MFLPHPNDWHAAVHIVPVRIGELGLAQSYEYKTAPYDRTFRLAFELDELRGRPSQGGAAMSWETASTESYMRRRYPFAFWDIQLLEQGGCVVSARVHDVQLFEEGRWGVVGARPP